MRKSTDHNLSSLYELLRSGALFCALLTTTLLGFGQNKNSDQHRGDHPWFINLNGGFGMLYGGFGSNLEVGKGHFSAYTSFGYATQRIVDNHTIKPSFNYQLGLRYYFNAGSDVVFPRVGIGYGWLTNYYSEAIGGNNYNQTVYGLTLSLGAQFYTFEGLVFNFDVGVGSKYTITAPQSHPHFFTVYVRPNIGIGYDLTRLFSKDKKSKRIKNKQIDPFGA